MGKESIQYKYRLGWAWLMILVVSCSRWGGMSSETISPNLAVPALPSSIPLTETRMPQPSSTPIKMISATPAPTQAPMLEPTLTLIPPSPTIIPDHSGTQTVEDVLAQSVFSVLQSARSPDSQWQAVVIRYDCVKVTSGEESAFEILKLTHLEDRKEAVLDTQLQNCGGVGAFGLGIVHWAPNSKYLYYTDAREGVPDGCSGGWWRPLYAVDVLSREKKELSLGPLSQDGKTLAYPAGTELVIWDINTGEAGRMAFLHPGWPVGGLAWSPQGDALVYLQNESGCSEGRAAVVRVNWPSLEPAVLLEVETPGFLSLVWDSANHIRLVDTRGKEWTVKSSPGR